MQSTSSARGRRPRPLPGSASSDSPSHRSQRPGCRRAVAARAALTDAINRLSPSVLRGINFSAEDGGPAPAFGGGVRRVEIFLRVGLGTRAFGFRVAISAERVADLNGPLPIGISDLGQTPAPPRLSTGQYGLAMSRVTIPDAAIGLLLRSAKFRHMAQALDDAYLDHQHWFALQKNNPNLRLNNNFRVASGGFAGRRILYVGTDPAGSLFIPGQSIENPTDFDIIRFNFALTNGDTIRWVEDVAHETAHAFARVTAQGPGPTTPVERVRAAVLDECNARRQVQQVFTEIRTTQAGRAALAGHNPLPFRTCDCERDWFPVLQKRTYLEHFVLGMDWESAARKLSDAEIQKITTDVAAIPLKWSTKPQPPTMLVAILRGTAQVGSFAKQFPVLTSAAGQAALVLRIVDASWRQLIAKVGEGSPTWTGGAQRLRLERHARVFFKIPVSYTRCP